MSGYSEPRGWIFGCGTGCEHSEIWFILIIPSAYRLNSRPPNHVSATPTHMLRICVNPLSAVVQTMRARSCSAFSCAMFARVVWMKLWGAKTTDLHHYSVPHELATHYFLRLTRARGRRFLRGRKALLNDFWYFWSCKSTIKEKLLQVSFRTSEKNIVRKFAYVSAKEISKNSPPEFFSRKNLQNAFPHKIIPFFKQF